MRGSLQLFLCRGPLNFDPTKLCERVDKRVYASRFFCASPPQTLTNIYLYAHSQSKKFTNSQLTTTPPKCPIYLSDSHLQIPSRTMPEFEPSLPSGWGHQHRAFLQALMSRGTLTLREARPLFAAIMDASEGRSGHGMHPADVTDDQIRSIISKCREAVAPLDYDIRATLHQMTREQVWALVNAHSDPATQLATSRTPDEISFVKRMLDAMFESYNTRRLEVMAIDAAQARKVARPPPQNNNRDGDEDGEEEAPQTQRAADKGLKHSDVERLLPSLVAEGWFEVSDGGYYTLSPRALLELKTWLLEEYNDPDAESEDWQRIKFCEACKDIITMGQRCPDRDCNVRLHDICTEAFWRTQREGKVCPRCKTAWTGKNYVGERAVTETAAAHRRAERAHGPRRSTMNGNGAVDEEEDDEADNE